MLVLSCVWLAVGPPFGLWPLVYWLPGLNFIRVASRFMLPAMLGLSVLSGLGFDWLTGVCANPRASAPRRPLAPCSSPSSPCPSRPRPTPS